MARVQIQDPEIMGNVERAQEQCATTGQPTYFKLRLAENQRKSVWGRWAAENLLSTERGGLTHGDGTGSYDWVTAAAQQQGTGDQVATGQHLVPSVDAPDRWVWQGEWEVERGACDSDGWQYAFVWGLDFEASSGARMFVRRRIWHRIMSLDPAAAKVAAETAAVGAAAASGGVVSAVARAATAGAKVVAVGAAATVMGIGALAIVCAAMDPEAARELSELSDFAESGDAGAASQFEGDLEKYIAPGAAIHLGTLDDALRGIGSLLIGGEGADDRLAQFTLEGAAAIEREFMHGGSAEDRSNYFRVRDGTYGDGKTLGALMGHESTKVAQLQLHHVLALRLYTTSSYARINSPMRTQPPTRPNPFAATAYFVSEAIKKLRVVEASSPSGMKPRTLWRGVQGMSLTEDFMASGGTEFACLSTSACSDVAVLFAKTGRNPTIFKFETKNCIERGADVAYLSVYQGEAEVLYPPLTFLHFKGVKEEVVAGTKMLVVKVAASIVGN